MKLYEITRSPVVGGTHIGLLQIAAVFFGELIFVGKNDARPFCTEGDILVALHHFRFKITE